MLNKTKLGKDEVLSILENYDLGLLNNFSLIKKGCVHSNYIVETSIGRFILRVYEERTDEQILLEQKLLSHLEDIEINTPKILQNRNENYITNFKDKRISIFTFLEGDHISDSKANLIQLNNLGKNLGRFHKSCTNFKPKEISSKYNYNKKWGLQILREVKADHKDFPRDYENLILEILDSIKLSNLPKGLNHGDFHGDNILFIGNEVSAILDFDDCFYGNLLSDIGSVIGYWCIKDVIDFSKCKSFLEGYESERRLERVEKEYLYYQTKLFMLIHLIYWLWNKKNWNKNIKPYKVLDLLNKISKEDFIKKLFN